MATLYVDTDVAGGLGDGSSLANAYASLSLAIAALPATFDDDYTILVHATNGTADTTGVTLPDTGSYSLTVKPGTGQEHNGVWDTSVYRLETADAIALDMTSDNDIGTQIVEGLQIRRTTASADYARVTRGTSFRTGTFVLRGCIVRGPANASYRARAIGVGGDGRFSPKSVFVNNIMYDLTGSSSTANSVFWGTTSEGAGDVLCYNNTIIGGEHLTYQSYRALDQQAWKFVNNIITTENIDADGTDGFVDCDYNSFEEAIDFGGTNDRQSQTFTFTDSAADDYSLTSDDTGALNHGTDLSADADYPFNTDIVGTTRTGTWDIGAFEYVDGTALPMPQYIYGE